MPRRNLHTHAALSLFLSIISITFSPIHPKSQHHNSDLAVDIFHHHCIALRGVAGPWPTISLPCPCIRLYRTCTRITPAPQRSGQIRVLASASSKLDPRFLLPNLACLFLPSACLHLDWRPLSHLCINWRRSTGPNFDPIAAFLLCLTDPRTLLADHLVRDLSPGHADQYLYIALLLCLSKSPLFCPAAFAEAIPLLSSHRAGQLPLPRRLLTTGLVST